MKYILILIQLSFLISCGTTLKTHDSGSIENRDPKLSPVYLAYNFLMPNDRHELFIFDSDDNRYQIKVDGSKKNGTLIFLPHGKKYFINSILHVQVDLWTEYIVTDFIKSFEVSKNKFNLVGEFVINKSENEGMFSIREMTTKEINEIKKNIRKKFKLNSYKL
jgi:hypothetical protein